MHKFHFLLRLGALLIISFTVACSVIPELNQEQASKVSNAYEKLSEHLAKIELGAFTSPKSFDPAIDDYAAFISGFQGVLITLPAVQNDSGQDIETSASAELVILLSNCLELIQNLANEHELAGLVPGSGISQPVRVGCDAATRAVLESVR